MGENNNKWIPCIIKKPETNKKVLVQRDTHSPYQSHKYLIDIMWINKFGHWTSSTGILTAPQSSVVAWMPLPELYIPEGE